jgi:hypothetical protein
MQHQGGLGCGSRVPVLQVLIDNGFTVPLRFQHFIIGCTWTLIPETL